MNGDTVNRKNNWPIIILSLLAVICLLFAGYIAWNKEQRENRLGEEGSPLIFLISREHGKNLSDKDLRFISDFLKNETGMYFTVHTTPSSLQAIESFSSEADIGLLNLFEYLLTRHAYGVEAVLQVIRRGTESEYSGVIVTKADQKINSIKDLEGKRFSFGDPFSTSGFVYPAKLLKDKGVSVSKVFSGSHTEALSLLKEGKVDAAAVFADAVKNDSSLRVIAFTDSIPNEPIFLRADMRAEKRDKIISGLRRLASTPEGISVLSRIADISGFKIIENKNYDDVIEVIHDAGMTIYDIVPEGIQVESRKRGIDLIP